ncbi:hypothetical protein, partial [Amycolatopsis sp. GM8]|uniref:hypothetical protein n=1 Tax=Amycolatopsis sp. GM8 TaxID=2896530 RepID=UPI001F3E13F4
TAFTTSAFNSGEYLLCLLAIKTPPDPPPAYLEDMSGNLGAPQKSTLTKPASRKGGLGSGWGREWAVAVLGCVVVLGGGLLRELR